jgi:hypothetical protein
MLSMLQGLMRTIRKFLPERKHFEILVMNLCLQRLIINIICEFGAMVSLL